MPRVFPSLLLVFSLAIAGCTGAVRGTRLAEAPKPAAVTTRVTAAEPGGIRVLINGRAPQLGKEGAWLAGDAEELEALWSAIGAEGPAPEVDFASHVVLGAAYDGGVCQPEIDAAEVDAAGTLRLHTEAFPGACIDLLVGVARAVAVPRRILPSHFVFAGAPFRAAYAFDLPEAKPHAPAPPKAPPTASSPERPSIAGPLGVVALPPRGNLTLRTLDDGRAVWVVFHRSGALSVLSADRASGGLPWLRGKVEWSPEVGRFTSQHDSAGRSVHGAAPLEARLFARQADGRIAVGGPAPIGPGPIEPRAEAPALEGLAEPYKDLPLVPPDAIPEGRVTLVDAAIVLGLSGPARLCNKPATPKLRARFPGCPDNALAVAGSPAESRSGVTILEAPVLVRRRGSTIDLGIMTSGGTSAYVVQGTLLPPAPRGESCARGALTLGAPARGDTKGAKDGASAPCTATSGAPDETWTFTAPRTGPYALQLDSSYDGALAVYDADGALLACNDDRHGFERSSIVHVPLTQGARVRVVVDGFGGQAGAYTLRVQEDVPLANGGVLVLGREAVGDTSKATDDQLAGCTTEERDDEWDFEVTEAGPYVFRIETPGWIPVISVLAEGASIPQLCTLGRGPTPPLVTDAHLDPGKYKIIVDGHKKGDAGPYRLRVERKNP